MNYSKEKVFTQDSDPFGMCQTLELSQELVAAKKEFFTSCVLMNAIVFSTFKRKLPVTCEQKQEYESNAEKISAILACRNFLVHMPKELDILGIKVKSLESYFLKIQQPNSSSALLSIRQQFLESNKSFKKAFCLDLHASVSEIFRFEVVNNIKSYDKLIQDADGNSYIIINQKLVIKTNSDIQALHDIGLHISGNLVIIDEQINLYLNVLIGAIKHLQEMAELLMKMFICKSQVSNYIFLKCKTLNLKIKILRSEICNVTYTKGIVRSHKKIHSYLNKKKDKTHLQLELTEHSLNSYEELGESYNALVNEHTSIQNKILKEKWAIKELKKKE